MARSNHVENLEFAWKALAQDVEKAEWRIISLRQPSGFTVHAARHYPENAEAVIISFLNVKLSDTRRLPEGAGFGVIRPSQIEGINESSSIALVRSPSGALDIFASMADDILGLLDRFGDLPAAVLMEKFIQRVVAWQLFMASPGGRSLSLDAQTGLFGELMFLSQLLDRGMQASYAVSAWDGPLHGAQDFSFGEVSIEVKSSAAKEGFIAKINSLEQLDDSDGNPLFLIALRLEEQPGSLRLPELIANLRHRFLLAHSLNSFDGRLRAVGYDDAHADEYNRSLALTEMRAFRIEPGFPRLFSGNIPSGVRRGSYEIEIDDTVTGGINECELFKALGLE